MTVVGRAYVNVRAVTREVEPDIKRGVEGALDRVSAQMSTPDGGGAKLGDSIGEGVRKSKVAKRIEQAVTDDVDTDRAGSALGDAIGRGIFDSLDFSKRLKDGLGKAVDAAIPDINEKGEKRGKDFGDRFLSGLGGALKLGINPIALIGLAVPPVVTQGLTAISTLSAGAVGILETLGPVAATAGVTGAAGITTLLTAVGALTLAFKTNSSALSALKEQFQPVKDDLRETGLSIQRDLFPVLAESANRIDTALGPELRRGLNLTADSVAGVTRNFTHLAESPFFQRNIDTILESNAVSLELFGKSGVNVAGILSDIGASAGPSVERVAKAVKDLSDDLFDNARVGATNGGLADFFDRAVDTTFQWSRIIGDVSSGLGGVLGQASELGGSLLGKLEGVTERFREWSHSATGQGSIGEFFDQSEPVIHAFGGVLGALGNTVADLSGDTGALVTTLDALKTGIPGLGNIVGETDKHFAALLSTILPLVGELAERLAPGIGDAAEALSDSLGPALERVVDPVGDLADNVLDLADNFAPVIDVAGRVLAPALDVVSTSVQGINAVLDALPGPVSTAIVSLVLLRAAFSRAVASEVIGPKIAAYKAEMAAVRADNVATQVSFAGVRAASATTIGVLGGPLGVALGVASIAFGLFAGHQKEAKESADDLTDAYDAQTGAITDLGKVTLNKDLLKRGLFDYADQLGLAYGDVTNAILGVPDAIERVNAALDANKYDPNNTAGAYMTVNQNAATFLGEAIDELSPKYASAADEASRLATAQSGVGNSADRAVPSLARMVKQNGEITGSTRTVNSTLQQMERRILSVNDAAIKAIEGQIGFRQAIADAKKDFADSADGLGLYTQAGRDNVSNLLDIAKAATSVEGSTKKQQKAMREARSTILELAKSKTDDDDKALKLTNRIFDLTKAYDKVPKDVSTEVDSPTIKEQIRQAKALREILEDMDGRTYNFSVSQGGRLPAVPGAANATTADTPAPPAPTTRPNAAPRRATPGADGGVNFNGPVTIQPKDYKDFTNNLQNKSRRRQLGGVGEP